LAAVATIRAPVAANGWPVASDEPATFSLDRSIDPSGASRPRRSRQNSASSHAARVLRTVEANASWISYRSKSCRVSLLRSSIRGTA
jgi:hypothetical protein